MAPLLVLPVRKALRRVRLDQAGLVDLAVRAALVVREGFPARVERLVPVARAAVLVVRPVRVALVAALAVLVDRRVPA
jgi:hypothetical protein